MSLKNSLLLASLMTGTSLTAGEKSPNKAVVRDVAPAPITQRVEADKTFELPGGISLKKSDLDKIKQENEELKNIDLLTRESDGFDGIKMKLDNKTHFVLMDSKSFQTPTPCLTFLSSKTGKLSDAQQMTHDDFKDVNKNLTDLVVKMGNKGLFNLDNAMDFLKTEAKKRGYSSFVLSLATPKMLFSSAMDTVFEARNLELPQIVQQKPNILLAGMINAQRRS